MNRSALAVVFCALFVAGIASAAVRRDGVWPEEDKRVTLDVQGVPRNEALRRLADAAGWSVVLRGIPTDPVAMHLKDQPSAKVLDVLLEDGSYVATRDGTLVSIAPASSSLPAEPEAKDAKDRVVTGGNVRVEKSDVVHDVVVFGGNADVFGTATGDVTVMGGRAHVYSGAKVLGDATAVGGELTIDDGARVEGDVGVVGGRLHKGELAQVGGREKVTGGDDGDDDAEEPSRWSVGGMVSRVGSALTKTALLFLFGAMVVALAGGRMDTLEKEIAARPMRSLALGVVGSVVGAAAFLVLCVTVIGIPFALIGAASVMVIATIGVCAALTVVGAAVARHKTTNPYAHLAVGCGLLLVGGAIPYVGTMAVLAVGLAGIGSLVATRGAGLIKSR